jgi:RNA polymerase II subunit A small phosphatase-like protein
MKPLLILDLDETLIHSEYNSEPDWYDFSFSKDSYGQTEFFYTQKRPFLKEFLNVVKVNFNLAIWTAASHEYAQEIIKEIGLKEEDLVFFYHKEMCTLRYDYDQQNYYGVKKLEKIKSFCPLERVLIVDDIVETAQFNYGNLINIKPFNGNRNDIELLKLVSYLEKIKDEPNFRRIEKRGWDYEK